MPFRLMPGLFIASTLRMRFWLLVDCSYGSLRYSPRAACDLTAACPLHLPIIAPTRRITSWPSSNSARSSQRKLRTMGAATSRLIGVSRPYSVTTEGSPAIANRTESTSADSGQDEFVGQSSRHYIVERVLQANERPWSCVYLAKCVLWRPHCSDRVEKLTVFIQG